MNSPYVPHTFLIGFTRPGLESGGETSGVRNFSIRNITLSFLFGLWEFVVQQAPRRFSMAANVIDMTATNAKETIEGNELVFIDFWAPWCGPCKRFTPIFEAMAEKNPDLKFVKVNTDDQPELAS